MGGGGLSSFSLLLASPSVWAMCGGFPTWPTRMEGVSTDFEGCMVVNGGGDGGLSSSSVLLASPSVWAMCGGFPTRMEGVSTDF